MAIPQPTTELLRTLDGGVQQDFFNLLSQPPMPNVNFLVRTPDGGYVQIARDKSGPFPPTQQIEVRLADGSIGYFVF
jgi:hypothetical protein